jgi:cytochrome c1
VRGLRPAHRQIATVTGVICVAIFLNGLPIHAVAQPASRWKIEGSDARRAPALIAASGCGSCHTIPGISHAEGNVGPPLNRFGLRTYVAGMLVNNPTNLVAWLRFPQKVVPGNAMPDMGLTESQARDIAAYLYTLK